MKKPLPCISLLILWIASFGGCQTFLSVRSDPLENSFFEKTRLIMTAEEKEIYKSLLNEEQKKEFIEEFWKIRDPYPETEENENKLEFERRILFANEWFDPFRRRRKDFMAQSARGWQTAKGRIYVILGPPASINYGGGWGPMKKFPPQDALFESWSYPLYDLTVFFERERIVAKLETIPPRGPEDDDPDTPRTYVNNVVGSGSWRMIPEFKIIYAIEDAKLRMISPQYRDSVHPGFRFKARYIKDRIRIEIPADKVVYIDKSGTLNIYLQIDIAVYRGDEKSIDIKENKVLNFSEEEVLKLDTIEIEVPFSPDGKGEYGFDITVTDLKSKALARFSQYIKYVF